MSLFAVNDWKPDELNAFAALASAGAALIALFVAAITAYYQRKALHAGWLSNSANMVSQFTHKYYEELKPARIALSQFLLDLRNRNKNKKPDEEIADLFERLEDLPLLSFFENLAYLTRIGVLDIDMVNVKFFWEVERWWPALVQPVDLVEPTRKKDNNPMLYKELEWLYYRLLEADRKYNQRSDKKPMMLDHDVEAFLKQEAKVTK